MKVILFEPWALGDAVIAASIAVHLPKGCFLACHSRWHGLLRSIFKDASNIELLPLNLPYTMRGGGGFLKSFSQQQPLELSAESENLCVLSIRGDPRDLFVAKKLFPKAHFKIRGILGFLARQSKVIDYLFSSGILTVTNRYKAWAKCSGIEFEKLQERFSRLALQRPMGEDVVIHIGAQWKARQYPFVKELVQALNAANYKVRVLSGPHDPLPTGMTTSDVEVVIDDRLIDAFQKARFAIVNDSGPMHLASALGVRAFCLARISNIAEWLPVGVHPIYSPLMPRGCRVDKRIYRGDEIIDGWPSTQEVLSEISKQNPLLKTNVTG